MSFVKCENCGKEIEVSDNAVAVKCSYCGTVKMISDSSSKKSDSFDPFATSSDIESNYEMYEEFKSEEEKQSPIITKKRGGKAKIIIIIAVVAILLSIAGFFVFKEFGKSESVKSVENAISAIGEVTFLSEESILQAENLYNKLSDKEKQNVSNINALKVAREEYDGLYNILLNDISMDLIEADKAVDELDIKSVIDIINNIRAYINEIPESVVEKLILDTYTDNGTLFEYLDEVEEKCLSLCINNTYIAEPQYVIKIESNGAWLVNDKETLGYACYNWWVADDNQLDDAYKEYKEYVSKHAKIIEYDDSFGFQDLSGDKVSVGCNEHILQVQVLKF